MMGFTFGGQHLRRSASPRGLCFSCLTIALAIAFVGCERPPRSKEEILEGMSEESIRSLDAMTNTPYMVDGIESPELIPAADARLKDSDQVIGVVIDSQPRAYPLSRVSSMSTHVVNDCVKGSNGENILFTVTYCDMRDCIRVFESTDPASGESLKISTLGLLDRGLALKWKDKNFKQTATVDGLRDIPYQRKTWAEWKAEFPDTVVYTGRSTDRTNDHTGRNR